MKCRICLSKRGTMVSPCGCKGSLQHVHDVCLDEWVSTSHNKCCDICGVEYVMPSRAVRTKNVIALCGTLSLIIATMSILLKETPIVRVMRMVLWMACPGLGLLCFVIKNKVYSDPLTRNLIEDLLLDTHCAPGNQDLFYAMLSFSVLRCFVVRGRLSQGSWNSRALVSTAVFVLLEPVWCCLCVEHKTSVTALFALSNYSTLHAITESCNSTHRNVYSFLHQALQEIIRD